MGRFINPFTDFGFKFLFGREVEKELLIDFLNDLLVGEHVITDIRFLNNEQPPEVKTERGLIYDIYCVTDTDSAKQVKPTANPIILTKLCGLYFIRLRKATFR